MIHSGGAGRGQGKHHRGGGSGAGFVDRVGFSLLCVYVTGTKAEGEISVRRQRKNSDFRAIVMKPLEEGR